jgi:lysophospholipase L1-like esterase
MRIQPGSKLLFIGDSITDCERAKPVGEGLFGAEGKGYVALVKAQLTAARPADRIRVVNMGTSGNTVLDLQKRWQTDVFNLKPDWLSIMIGINDVWRQHDLPLHTDIHVREDQYAAILEELVSRTKGTVKGLVLMTPYFIEPNKQDAMRVMMDGYGAVVKKTAEKHGAIFVDTQAAIDQALQHMHPGNLAWDRVHPTLAGHMILARAFLGAVGAL